MRSWFHQIIQIALHVPTVVSRPDLRGMRQYVHPTFHYKPGVTDHANCLCLIDYVYNAFSAVVGNDVPAYLMPTNMDEDARRCTGFLKFKDVVKAHPITPSVAATPAVLSSKLETVGVAASKLAAASYPHSSRTLIGHQMCI